MTSINTVGAGIDPVLRVFDANGRQIAANDDANPNTRDAVIEFDAVAGRTYYFGVTDYSDNAIAYDVRSGDGLAALTPVNPDTYELSVADVTPLAISNIPDQTVFAGAATVFIAAGVLDGDGFADVVAGGPGGGPRVCASSCKGLVNGNQEVQLANFSAANRTAGAASGSRSRTWTGTSGAMSWSRPEPAAG